MALHEIGQAFKGVPPEEVEREVAPAVAAARRKQRKAIERDAPTV